MAYLCKDGCKLSKNSWRCKIQDNHLVLLGSLANPTFLKSLHYLMHHNKLGQGTYELTLLKGDNLHYCQGLIKALQENAKLITISFHSELPGDKDLKDH